MVRAISEWLLTQIIASFLGYHIAKVAANMDFDLHDGFDIEVPSSCRHITHGSASPISAGSDASNRVRARNTARFWGILEMVACT